jgi:aryl-alcohol dehydrogenase-like predicted oxidoreductase
VKYNLLGNTGLYVSEICLGTMTFAGESGIWRQIGEVDRKGAGALLRTAFDAGVNFIDTADVYANGGSERVLGQAIRDLGLARSDLVIATKVRGRTGTGPNAVGLSRGHILDAVQASLDRLGTDHIDLYQIHGFDRLTPIEETLEALDLLVRRGMVRYVGCSNLAAWQIMKALGISRERGLSRFESVQAYYSLACRDLEHEIMPLVEDQKLGILVWSPLAGGFLSGKFRRGQTAPEDARRTVFNFPPVDVERAYDIVEVASEIGAARGASPARVALSWLLQRPNVTSVIVGARRPDQLADNLAAAELELSADEAGRLEAATGFAPIYPRWMIERQGADRLPGASRR